MGYDSPRIPKNLKVSLGFLQVIVVICGHMYYQVQTTVVWGVRKESIPSYFLYKHHYGNGGTGALYKNSRRTYEISLLHTVHTAYIIHKPAPSINIKIFQIIRFACAG